MEAVRAERRLSEQPVPPLCVLDFDGDLSDHLARKNISLPWESWACFHLAWTTDAPYRETREQLDYWTTQKCSQWKCKLRRRLDSRTPVALP